MILAIASDGVTVSITPEGDAKVEDLGGSTYNPTLQRFELYYSFTNASNQTVSVVEIITNVNAPVTSENE
jgi:hypothetical protein